MTDQTETRYEPIAREREFYGRALRVATEGSASTGYGMPFNQTMRFLELRKQLLAGTQSLRKDYRLLDIGCGTGDLLPFLRDIGMEPGQYVGVDLMPEMVQAANARADKENWPTDWYFTTGDLRDAALVESLGKFDIVTCIAAYALKEDHDSQQENIALVQDAIEKMAAAATEAVFVTLFSTWKTNIIPEEMVLDPVTMLAWAKTKWERVDLIHSYAPFDFTLVIYPGKSPWREQWEEQNAPEHRLEQIAREPVVGNRRAQLIAEVAAEEPLTRKAG